MSLGGLLRFYTYPLALIALSLLLVLFASGCATSGARDREPEAPSVPPTVSMAFIRCSSAVADRVQAIQERVAKGSEASAETLCRKAAGDRDLLQACDGRKDLLRRQLNGCATGRNLAGF